MLYNHIQGHKAKHYFKTRGTDQVGGKHSWNREGNALENNLNWDNAPSVLDASVIWKYPSSLSLFFNSHIIFMEISKQYSHRPK